MAGIPCLWVNKHRLQAAIKWDDIVHGVAQPALVRQQRTQRYGHIRKGRIAHFPAEIVTYIAVKAKLVLLYQTHNGNRYHKL